MYLFSSYRFLCFSETFCKALGMFCVVQNLLNLPLSRFVFNNSPKLPIFFYLIFEFLNF